MHRTPSRRRLLQAAAILPFARPEGARASDSPLRVAGRNVEIQIFATGRRTSRIRVLPLDPANSTGIDNGALAERAWPDPAVRIRTGRSETLRSGHLAIRFDPDSFSLTVEDEGRLAQRLRIDRDSGKLSFLTGAPVFGLGEGGPQFDRRGSRDPMRSGQAGYRLHTHGGRVPAPWLIGASGWALFINQPFGTFDLRETEGEFAPASPQTALPLDVFVVASRNPGDIMAAYAELTGFPEMPPLWSLGYQQSHRTLASRAEVIAIAETFREKRLPCDALIYLGTGFCPSGWNTANGSFSFNPDVFPDPKDVIDRLHAAHFRVVLHSVILSPSLRGTVRDECQVSRFDEAEASCLWDAHRKVFAQGVDGWWPDEGDPLDIRARLVRNRMYWDGPQLDRPNERPFALHRNGYAGMQRYAAFLWSGDVYSTWETLRTHIPIAINTGLTGIPYWGTDIGGFVPTKELTGELYVRWFQFGAFNPLFRAHGRTWKLRLPWGWNTGELGPNEITPSGEVSNPGPEHLHDARVEPICRKYLELRYRLMPYLYTAVRECCQSGMPVIRALWLHYPDDPIAVERADEYLWGRDILVAPVTEPGATFRDVYLPRGVWFDFWTKERVEGGREIRRPVNLETTPLYIRAGSLLPLWPVKQYTDEKVDAPLQVEIYPGSDRMYTLYEDDGKTFDYRRGAWMGLNMAWRDNPRTMAVRLAEGSRMLPPLEREIEFVHVTERARRRMVFSGRVAEISF